MGKQDEPWFPNHGPCRHFAEDSELYIGADGATGKLQASLSDNSAAPYVDTSMVTDGDAAGTYSIDFEAASAGQTLTVTYTLQDFDWGDVTIEAAALTPKHPDVTITQPAPDHSPRACRRRNVPQASAV